MTGLMRQALLVAAGGVAGRRRPWERRGHLYDLLALVEPLIRHDERPIRELARTLHSEATRALQCRRSNWLHRVVAALVMELVQELAPRQRVELIAVVWERSLPATSRCAACDAVIGQDRIMCFAHLQRVSPDLQVRIFHADDTARPELVRLALESLRRSSGKLRRVKDRRR